MEVKRIFDIVDVLLKQYNKEDALAVKRNGVWVKFSTEKYCETVDFISYGLLAMGFKKGDKIASVSNNRPEWNFIDMGMSQIGVVHVPIYPNVGKDVYKHIFRHSESKILILATEEFYTRIKPFATEIQGIQKIFTVDVVEGVANLNEIIELGRQNQEKYKLELENIKTSISEDDLCTIIYTSGTTDMPKGVMLSHKNFISNVIACEKHIPLDVNDRTLSFLPLCHVLERMVNYLTQFKGASVYYAESIDTIGENLREVQPAEFTTVPRVLEKLYDKILTRGKDLKGIKRKIFFWAIRLAENYELTGKSMLYKFQLKIVDKLVFKKWREALGNKVKCIVVGGAACQVRLIRIFYAAGIRVAEGYGLTETSPVISVNMMKISEIEFGSVGPLIETSQVKIAEDGEILFKGPNLMLGYYKDKELTVEVIDSEGWFHTGDIGVLNDRNILKITDRKKEIFKLTTGVYVAPQVVENKFKSSPLIEQIMVVGAGEKFTTAVIVPNFVYLHDWCSIHDIHFTDNEDLIKKEKIIERFQKEIDELNKDASKSTQVKKFVLTCDKWSPETGELSPTLKLMRRTIKTKYKAQLDKIYGYN